MKPFTDQIEDLFYDFISKKEIYIFKMLLSECFNIDNLIIIHLY